MKQALDALFNPENVAVVGASGNPLKAGYTILDNMINIGYPKKIFPINVTETEILGIPCHKKLSQVEDTVELVVLITPSHMIFDLMDDLELRMRQKNDVKVIVCAAAGYGEVKTEDGAKRQACLMDTAKKWGIRVVGPNCIGLIDNVSRVDTTFVETHLPKAENSKVGGISFISQSGSIAASLLMWGASQPVPMAMNKFISIGNMADVDFIDLLEYYENDPDTKVIGMYMEGYPKGRELIDTLARIARKKPVVVLKVGRSEIGAKAANSHTGSLAGADAVYDAAFRQYGILRVYTFKDLLDTLQAFDSSILPKGNRCFILTQAGGPGIYCTDAFMEEGSLRLPTVSDETKKKLAQVLPDMANICSPEGYADITASASVAHHVESLRTVIDDDQVDSVIFITVTPTFLPRKELGEALAKLLADEGYGKKKPVYICIMAGEYVRPAREALAQKGIYTYDTPLECVNAAVCGLKYRRFLDRVEAEASDASCGCGKGEC